MQILFNTLHNKNSQYQYIPFSGKTENFWKNYNKQFKNIALKETIKKSINNEENFLGEGMWKKGYNFSELKNYVIRVYKKVFSQEDLENKFIKPEKNPLNDLEEVVLTIPNKIDIVKKKFGKSLGVPQYTEKILTTNSKPLSNIIVNRKESLELLDSFEKLKDFPIKSYEKAYAQLKKFCSVQDYQFDPINPNNILIDVETKQINLIDPVTPTVNHPVHGKNRNFSKIHGSDSLYAVICDFLIHENHINNLKPEEIKRWDNAINTIIAKCIIAGKKNGLDSNIQELRNLYSRIGNFWETDQVTQKYDNFIKKYSRAIEQAHIIANAIDYKNNEKNRINAINQINIEDFKKIKNVFKTILKAPHQAKVEFPEIINATIDKIFEYKESAKIITPILEELFDKEIFCTTKKKLYNYFILYNPTNKKFLNEIEKSAENIFESNLFKEEFNLLYSRLEKLPHKKREAVNKICKKAFSQETLSPDIINKLWISRTCTNSSNSQKIAIDNIKNCYKYINNAKNRQVEVQDIIEIHKIALANIPNQKNIAGKLRTPETDELVRQIFKIKKDKKQIVCDYSDSANVVNDLKILEKFIIDNYDNENVFLLASTLFSEITRIHPFLNGNGRATRLFVEQFLLSKGYILKKWPEESLYRKIYTTDELAKYLEKSCTKCIVE